MFFYYRISDNSYKKDKIPGVSKKDCLSNFLSIFTGHGIILMDNCNEQTKSDVMDMVSGRDIELISSSYGNAGAIRWCINDALSKRDGIVYFVEDDYLHHPDCANLLVDGLNLPDVSYVTLFDHPDKYTDLYGYGETSKVFRTKKCHWRQTQSTTMTFACRVDKLDRDLEVWNQYTDGTHPHDHEIFTKILEKNLGRLVCSIPGYAVHTDLSVSIALGNVCIESWAMEMSLQIVESKLSPIVEQLGLQNLYSTLSAKGEPNSWERLRSVSLLLL